MKEIAKDLRFHYH